MELLAVLTPNPAKQESIQPILQDHCYECHGFNSRKGNFSLANHEPNEILFQQPMLTQQIKIIAEWEDGAREDVTCLARFQTNNDASEPLFASVIPSRCDSRYNRLDFVPTARIRRKRGVLI